jgi:branched-chain amino acid transport system permease protein
MRILLALTLAIYLLHLGVKNPYYLNVLAIVGLYTMVTVGLSLFIGYAGQISLGHGAFYGLGAYLSAILSTRYGINPWVSCLLAISGTTFLAWGLGYLVLRLRGHYLVMATLGINLVVYFLFIELEEFTGGLSGLPGIPPLCVREFCFASDRSCYYLIWTVALLVILGCLRLTSGRLGRELRAIRGSELAARALGLRVTHYKAAVFALSAALAALAGGLYAHYFTFISPKTFDIFYSVEVVTMVLVGGMGSIWGAVLGAAFLTPLPQLLDFFDEYKDLFYGAILMFILVWQPQGLKALIPKIGSFFSHSGKIVRKSASL